MSRDSDKGPLGRLWGGDAREKTPASGAKVLPPARYGSEQDRIYVAFTVRDHAERLHIIRATSPARFPASSYLLDISYDRFHQSAFTLVYTFMVVDVKGWNLESIVKAISGGACESIVEFDNRQHDHPGKGEPLIESIQITTADEE